jgi:hypothetical protein
MKTTDTAGARAPQHSTALSQSFRNLILALQATFCISTFASACPVDSLPLSALDLQIHVFSDAPGTVRIQLVAGDPAHPVKQLLGYDLQLALNAEMMPGATAQFRSLDTWPARDGQFAAHISCDPVTGEVALSFRRDACQSVSGSGLIGEIIVRGLIDPVDPEDLVRVSAGLVLEEIVNGAKVQSQAPGNHEIRLEDALHPEPAQNPLQAGPVPARDHLLVTLPADGAFTLELIDAQGKRCYLRRHEGGQSVRMDLQDLPRGHYWLRQHDDLGNSFSRIIPLL